MSNRIIKFRIWDVTELRYIEVYDMDPEGEWVHVAQGDQLYLVNSPLKTEFVLEQFTGLLDKNGKEIYEGDILKTGNVIKEVCFGHYHDQESYGHYGWYCNVRGPGLFSHEWSLNDDYDPSTPVDAEIIGNIHENPDLLK